MSNSHLEHVFAGIAVTNYHRSLRWYTSLFGRAPDVIVREDYESMWQLTERAWVYIVYDPSRAGKALVTALVPSLEEHVGEISKRGLGDWETQLLPGVYRKAVFTDADGNTVTFAQTLHEET